jgi:hypothetical protein
MNQLDETYFALALKMKHPNELTAEFSVKKGNT